MKRCNRKWEAWEEEYLETHFPNQYTQDVANFLKRSYKSVALHAMSKGIRKSEEFELTKSTKLKKGAQIGKEFWFNKGDQPWNKGKKYNPGGRSLDTRFQKGHSTWAEFTIVVDKNKKPYKMVRVAPGKRRPYHQMLWIEHNGPIPEGFIVTFINGDTMDCRIENLTLISRSENMKRNTWQRFSPELKSAIRTLSKLKHKINEKQDN